MGVSKAQKVELSRRRYQAVQMRIAGVSNTLIAERLGYGSPQAVSKDITDALKRAAKQESLAAEQLLQLEIDRLDRVMAAIWPKVLKGDVTAADTALKIINRRAILLGLDQINRNGVADTDMVSLLGNMLISLQQRHVPADPDSDAILEADVVREIEHDDGGGE